MSVAELKRIPPVQGTNLSIQSIRVQGTGSNTSYQTPLSNFYENSFSTDFYFSNTATGPSGGVTHLGPTGTITCTAISDKMFINIPGFSGSTGATASYLISSLPLPTGFVPSSRAFSSCAIVANGSSYDDGICSIETSGNILVFPRQGGTSLIGQCVVPKQTISYNL